MALHVFTYGSLMFAEVWQRVVKQAYRFESAELHDHARYAVIGETYPGVVARAGSRVPGIMYFDVAPADLAALDAFEGPDYRRQTVAVWVNGDKGPIIAETYIFCKEAALSSSGWEAAEFDLASFIKSYCRMDSSA